MFIDYEILRVIWWVLLGVLLIGFAIMDGFDLGVGMLLPFVAKKDTQRRVVINTIGPVWEGNQVWFVLGGGAVFAAFPLVYAGAFSGFYGAMFLVLVALILRPGGFTFRNKIKDERWRKTWDWCLFVGGFVPALVFGVAVGNLLLGVPLDIDSNMVMHYRGHFWQLLNPFGLLCGLLSVSMLVMHGGTYLINKTDGEVRENTKIFVKKASIVTAILFAIGGIVTAKFLDGFYIVGDSKALHSLGSNPFNKTVNLGQGAWLMNYTKYSFFILAPVIAFVCTGLTYYLTEKGKEKLSFVTSALSVAGIIATAGVSLFPFLMPSSVSPNLSLTIWDASSSSKTLTVMLMVVVAVFPIVLLYTSWVYRVLRGKITEENIISSSKDLY